jgi:hypothetical protein
MAVPPEAEAVKQQYGSYALQRAQSEGYVRDEFCLDAAALGQPAQRGAMGFHAADPSLLRGPIDANRPQALMFDVGGRILGVEYEVTTDAVRDTPRLFDRTFTRLTGHPGVQGDHYALHFWFVDNPSGPFDDFNPSVSCPAGTTPPPGGHPTGHLMLARRSARLPTRRWATRAPHC